MARLEFSHHLMTRPVFELSVQLHQPGTFRMTLCRLNYLYAAQLESDSKLPCRPQNTENKVTKPDYADICFDRKPAVELTTIAFQVDWVTEGLEN